MIQVKTDYIAGRAASRRISAGSHGGVFWRAMRRKLLDVAGQLPPAGPARAAVIASLVLGGIIATALTALILVFVVTAFGR